jgi:hypothetical protein
MGTYGKPLPFLYLPANESWQGKGKDLPSSLLHQAITRGGEDMPLTPYTLYRCLFSFEEETVKLIH